MGVLQPSDGGIRTSTHPTAVTKRLTTIGFLLAAVLIFLSALRHRPSGSLQELTTTPKPIATSTELEPEQQRSLVATQHETTPPNHPEIAIRQARAEQKPEEKLDNSLDEWRTPIEFYGKVVDEAEIPIPGAQVTFTCNDLSTNGTSHYNTESDGQGIFSISGINGKLLTAHVFKEGYYFSRRNNDSFYYAGQNENFVPESNNPVVFHLRSIGTIAPLILVAGSTLVPKDDRPVGLALTKAKAVPEESAEFLIQCWTGDKGTLPGQKFDWRCKLTVPGGGIQEIMEEFPFQAPESGYQLSVEINMPASLGDDWRDKIARSYFLKLGNGDYARIDFEMIPYGEHFALIKSYVNPTGSRNLESDANVHFTRLSK
jgi:hypothetical protein